MVKIEILPDHTATIDGYVWRSDDETLQDLLNSMLDPNGPPGGIPDPDWEAAQAAIEQLGGEIVEHEAVESEAGRVY